MFFGNSGLKIFTDDIAASGVAVLRHIEQADQ
jgi:hypothetical protein